jgi:hypothetical protein
MLYISIQVSQKYGMGGLFPYNKMFLTRFFLPICNTFLSLHVVFVSMHFYGNVFFFNANQVIFFDDFYSSFVSSNYLIFFLLRFINKIYV